MRIYTRAEFTQLLGMSSNYLNQRTVRGEIALSFERIRPLHHNEYTPPDAFMVLLTSMLVGHTKADWKNTSAMVRKHWRPLLEGTAKAERDMDAGPSTQTSFAMAIVFNEDGTTKRASAGVGRIQEAVKAAEHGEAWSTIFVMSLQRVVRQLRVNAKINKVELPEFIIPAVPGTAAFEKWIEDVLKEQQDTTKAKARKAKATV